MVDKVARVAAEPRLGGALRAVVHRLLRVFPGRTRRVAGSTEAHLASLAGVFLLLRRRDALQDVALGQAGDVLRLGVWREVFGFELGLQGRDGQSGAGG